MSASYRTLLIEDNPGDARLMREMLLGPGNNFEVETAERLADGLDRLQRQGFDAILLDLGLPDSQGLETFERLHAATPDTPVVVITGNDDIDLALRAVQAGAQDYLVKGQVHGNLVTRSVRYAVERKRAEAALREGEAKYRRLVETLHEGVWSTDAEALTTYANPRMAGMLGCAVSEMIGRPVTDFTDAAGAVLAKAARARRRQGITEAFPFEFLHKDGHRIHTIVEACPILDAQGAFLGSVGAIRDVTDVRQAEERIGRLNRLYRTTSEVNQLIVRERDPQLLLSEACRIFVETGEFVLAWVGVLDPETGRLRPWAAAGLKGFHDDVEIRIDDSPEGWGPSGRAYRDGTPVLVQDWTCEDSVGPWREKALALGIRSSAAAPIVQDHRVLGILNVYAREPNAFEPDVLALLTELVGDLAYALQGIEESKRRGDAEQALHASERKYKHFFEQDLAGHYVSTPEGRVTACNTALARLLGFAAAENALGSSLAHSASPGANEEFRSRLETSGRVDRVETALRRRDGTSVAVIESAVGVRDERGELHEIHGFVLDDTERKEAEAEFRQAQKMEAVGRLAGGVAHDFNNLLGVIIGYGDLLQRSQTDAASHRKLEQIQRAAERGAGLTRQLLAFSRKQVLTPRPLALDQLVQGLEPMLRRLIGEDVRLVTSLRENLGLVMVDRGQIEQVLMNLAVNARDAMPEGGTLSIEACRTHLDEGYVGLHPEVVAGPYIELSVRDTGCGMDAATLAHIFEPFFTTKEAGKGTGLGLATVYGIVKQSGGHIEVESAPETGTTFRIRLPLLEGVADCSAPPAGDASLAMGSETILVLEDDAALRDIVQETLRLAGYDVLTASRPEEGLALLQTHPETIDLLLSDVIMPGKSGPDFAAELAVLRPGTKILYMSGYTDESVARRRIHDAGLQLLQKPFTPEALLQEIRATLDSPARQPGPTGAITEQTDAAPCDDRPSSERRYES